MFSSRIVDAIQFLMVIRAQQGAGEEQGSAQACLGGALSVSNRVDRLRFAAHLFLTRAPIGLERSDSPIK